MSQSKRSIEVLNRPADVTGGLCIPHHCKALEREDAGSPLFAPVPSVVAGATWQECRAGQGVLAVNNFAIPWVRVIGTNHESSVSL